MALPRRCPCGCKVDLRFYTHFPGGMKFLRCPICAGRVKMDLCADTELLPWQKEMEGTAGEETPEEHATHGRSIVGR
jgi:hypothetical protein